MRSFIVLCLIAIACADKLGYNYQPVGHSDSGLSVAPGGGSHLSNGNGGLFGGNQGGNVGSPSQFDPSVAAPSGSSANYAEPAGGELEKEFYSFTADDADFNEPASSDQIANSLKQGLRVVFIKGPESNGLENAAINLAKHASEQHTAIYVLNKQADIGDLAHKLNAVHDQNNNKPEVHFVKYRTPEDAANAQRQIQGQYDQLGGASSNHDGGVAPVLNFASKAPAPAASHGGQGGQGAGSAPGASYLPASIFRSFRQ